MAPGKDATFAQAVRGALLAHTCPLSFWDIVARRDAEDMLPAIVGPGLLRMALPWWTKYAALAALVAALWLHGWTTGREGVREDWEAATAEQEAAALAHSMELAKRADEITLVYLGRRTDIEERIRTIEVTKYVTAKSDAACPVPVGLVRLWDDSAGVQTRIYQPASGVDDAARDVALADVGRGIVEARRRFEVNRAQCIALQEWIKGVAR